MPKKRTITGIILYIGLGLLSIKAQETVSTAGGLISGNGGSISYTLGQVVYTTNFANTGSAAQGVQQPFEISILTESETIKESIFICNVFPNPTTNALTLIIKGNPTDFFSYQLYNLNGILLESDQNIKHKSNLSLLKYKDSVFILKVVINDIEIRTYKIIKKS